MDFWFKWLTFFYRLEEAEEKYRSRQSRPEDLEIIEQLKRALAERELDMKKLVVSGVYGSSILATKTENLPWEGYWIFSETTQFIVVLFLLGREELFPDGVAEQGNQLQQGFQSSTKYWSNKPTSGKNQTWKGTDKADYITCDELLQAGSNT